MTREIIQAKEQCVLALKVYLDSANAGHDVTYGSEPYRRARIALEGIRRAQCADNDRRNSKWPTKWWTINRKRKARRDRIARMDEEESRG